MMPRLTVTLEVAGRRVRLGEQTLVMGVLNVTPDSFSDGGLYLDARAAVERGLALAREGADWIDVGGESTRPGSKPVAAEEEVRRILPVIRVLHRRLPKTPISVDTTKAEVAEAAIAAGASVINDVSGLRFDPRIALVVRRHRVPLVLMHLRGRPATMQSGPFARDVWRSVSGGLSRSIRRALESGVRRSQIMIDPGLGFGKTRRQNFEILAGLERLRRFGLPVLVGTSRKSFVQAVVAGEPLEPSIRQRRTAKPWLITAAARAEELKPSAEKSLEALASGDAAAVAAAILAGAHIVRVHDVAAVLPAIRIADAILAAGAQSGGRA